MTAKRQLQIVEGWNVTALSDGTLTQAEVSVVALHGWASPRRVGLGEARRRKGDRQDPGLGEMLAVARAFEDAARTIRGLLAERGYGDVA